jgi:alkanesulfonate monooxygenase SsuD/methylene tetrahydromethanopterin reductase-like flavin-dependent oxidoreductase (luciferase family)
VRLSVCLDPGRPWSEASALARHVDAAGWHAVYQCDHFMPHRFDDSPSRGDVTECWTTLSALSVLTSRVRLGSLVLGNTYRHPAVVASMAATLDRISGGRVVLGLGAGWQPNEHGAYGIPLPGAAARIEALGEACAILRMLLDDGLCTFVGSTYRLRDATCEPSPVQERLPLLVGGGGELRTMKVAAQYADVWHCWAGPAAFAAKNEVLDQHCRDVGRDPAAVARATGAVVALAPARTDVSGDPQDADVVGSIAQVTERLLRFGAAGADEFIVRDVATTSLDSTLALIDRLTEDVLPALAE